jgi:hypothetical protein
MASDPESKMVMRHATIGRKIPPIDAPGESSLLF